MTRGPYLYFLLILLTFSTGCQGGFDEATGVYKGEGVTATFPTGWETFSGVPNAVVARQDPDSTAKIFLAVEDAPGFVWKDYNKGRLANLSRRGMTETQNGRLQVDGVTARWSVVKQKQQGEPFRSISYYFHANGKLYNLTGLASAKEFGSWRDQFKQVANSVGFE